MNFINSPKNALGLDISDLTIKAVQLKKKKGKANIKAVATVKLQPGIIEEGVILDFDKAAGAIRKMLNTAKPKFSTKYAVLALPETKTFIKVIEVPNKNKKISELITEEIPKHVPVNLDEMRVGWQEIKMKSKKRKFLIGMVPEKIGEEYTRLAKMAGIIPVALEIEAQAITRALEKIKGKEKVGLWNKLMHKKTEAKIDNKPEKPKIILDIGAKRTSLILVDKGVIQFTNSLNQISGQTINSSIMEKMKLDGKEAEKLKIICGANPKKCKGGIVEILDEVIKKLANEINNAESFYQTHFTQDTKGLTVVLCGGGASLAQIDKKLEQMTNRKTITGDPTTNIIGTINKGSLTYTTAIGLALRNLS